MPQPFIPHFLVGAQLRLQQAWNLHLARWQDNVVFVGRLGIPHHLTAVAHEHLAVRHSCQQQTAIPFQPLFRYQQQLARGEHEELFALKNGVAQVGKRHSQTTIFEDYGDTCLQPVALPLVALLHTQRTDIIDFVGRLHHLYALLVKRRAIAPQPFDQFAHRREKDKPFLC